MFNNELEVIVFRLNVLHVKSRIFVAMSTDIFAATQQLEILETSNVRTKHGFFQSENLQKLERQSSLLFQEESLNYTTTFYEDPFASQLNSETHSLSLKEEEEGNEKEGQILFRNFSQNFKHKKISLINENAENNNVSEEVEQKKEKERNLEVKITSRNVSSNLFFFLFLKTFTGGLAVLGTWDYKLNVNFSGRTTTKIDTYDHRDSVKIFVFFSEIIPSAARTSFSANAPKAHELVQELGPRTAK